MGTDVSEPATQQSSPDRLIAQLHQAATAVAAASVVLLWLFALATYRSTGAVLPGASAAMPVSIVAHGSALAGFLVLSVATAAGAYTAGSQSRVTARLVWQYLHRASSACGVALVIVHSATMVVNSQGRIGPIVFIPFASGFDHLLLPLGVLAFDAIAIVTVIGIMRTQISKVDRAVRLWRPVHLLAYVAWILATAHFWCAIDNAPWWSIATLLVGGAFVLAGGISRIVTLTGAKA
ncbi:MAG TPA: hypothetical protein VIU87_22605 [Mycobacterium sp.]